MLGLVLFSVAGGLWGSGELGPRLGDVKGIRWVIVLARRHGPLRRAHIRSVSVARAGQVDAFPAGVPDRQALVECVERSRVVGSYKGSLLGKVGSPGFIAAGSAAVGVTPLVGSSEERRWSRGRRVVSSLADCRSGIYAARARWCVVAALPVTGCAGEEQRVPRRVGRGGPEGVAPRVHEGVFPVAARVGSGPGGVSHAPQKGAAEDTEDFVHKGRVCRLGLRLNADGRLQLLAQRQRLDLVDREDWA